MPEGETWEQADGRRAKKAQRTDVPFETAKRKASSAKRKTEKEEKISGSFYFSFLLNIKNLYTMIAPPPPSPSSVSAAPPPPPGAPFPYRKNESAHTAASIVQFFRDFWGSSSSRGVIR